MWLFWFLAGVAATLAAELGFVGLGFAMGRHHWRDYLHEPIKPRTLRQGQLW